MRIAIKGGLWKNTEDEILKAAIMKYGDHEWARISSLLPRKSPKQCKTRWYEWLDPSIKKIEWTREEDEKLLNMARWIPTQWRSMAPIVGRTPSQCLERYEKLLDAACAKDDFYEAYEDPRKLRPGEMDPNPESRPALPDPVDMDEDEKEMLSESRARLANIKGKKAKRKAREKQLEDARRLATLQKRRELKAAGIEVRLKRRKRRGIDYNAEVPFQKKPPSGFYNTADEDKPEEQPEFPTTVEVLEGKRRADVETELRKQDIARNKIAQRQGASLAIKQENIRNYPEAIRKRAKLMLPPPLISDHELEEICKMSSSDVFSVEDFAEVSTNVSSLPPNYLQIPQGSLTPFRTPRGTVGIVAMKAENLAKLREWQTPMLGGKNPEQHLTSEKMEIQTSSPVPAPRMTPGAMGAPSIEGYSAGMKLTGTPCRHSLHSNENMGMQNGLKLGLQRQAEIRQKLHSGLAGLPVPKSEYQVVVMPVSEENEEVEEQIEEDTCNRVASGSAEEEEARQEALFGMQSKVLQRELPDIHVTSLDENRSLLKRRCQDQDMSAPSTLLEQADELVNGELFALLQCGNDKYLLEEESDKEMKKRSRHGHNANSAVYIPDTEDFDKDELEIAGSLIKEELQSLHVAMGHKAESLDDVVKGQDAREEDLMLFPAHHLSDPTVAANSEKLEALQVDFDNLKRRLDRESKKATKYEHKAEVLTRGYQMRARKLWSQIDVTFKQMDTADTELECFEALQRQEYIAASYRVRYSIGEVSKQREFERTLQGRYQDLLIEYQRQNTDARRSMLN